MDFPKCETFSYIVLPSVAPPDVATSEVGELVRVEQKRPEVVFLDDVSLEFV